MSEKNKFLFEVSWEVCNKVGGIYTVIVSKLAEVVKEFGGNYCLIGPLLDKNEGFVEESSDEVLNIKHKLESRGIHCKIGRWNTPERPKVILIKYTDVLDKDKLLYELWEFFAVDSMTGSWDYLEPVMFSTVAGKVIEAMTEVYENHDIIAHFHEWMTGAGLLYLKQKVPEVATVFTTHATILGRSMAGNGIDIYNLIDLTPEKDASKYNVLAKYSMERASAREADCFTTVSHVTAIEALKLLNNKPDVILPNGFNVKGSPDFQTNPDYFTNNREKLLAFASKFLDKDLRADNTFIMSTSGRYEFHNKGIDVLINAICELNNDPAFNPDKNVVLFLFVIAGSIDVNTNNVSTREHYTRYSEVATHPLWNYQDDPILTTCKRFELQNDDNDKINVIFIPVYLNGHDGILNMPYYDALSGCDLTIYPSYYEPWGYTPLESIAYGVPTITSDLAGFGQWVLSEKIDINGIKVMNRSKNTYEVNLNDLKNLLTQFIVTDISSLNKMRKEVRNFAMKAEWELFYSYYIKAYQQASKECYNRLKGIVREDIEPIDESFYRGTDSSRPRLRSFSVKTSIPVELQELRTLAYNLWWSWMPEAHHLFSRLDPLLYDKLGNNPVNLLETIPPQKLKEITETESYMLLYENVIKKFHKYITEKKSLVDMHKVITKDRPVAYFSMEFGLHESLPIYSGGLGILSGDHMKSASDVNLHLIGIGLLYKKGYFKQGISKDGDQKTEYFTNDFYRMPVEEVFKGGKRIEISVELPGRVVYAKAWKANVGRVTIYFLDTNILKNSPADREITSRLYGGGKKVRIEQEILLGIGGIRLLQELNITPSVYHMNEGHSAFLILERIINQMRYNHLDFETARNVIRSSTVFTTHTPVAAGNETFDMTLVENYLKSYVESNDIKWQDFVELGQSSYSETGPYEMTVLALKNSCKRNGVSKLHGIVSRKMWMTLWKSYLQEEVPIKHITNGVHVGSWLSTEMKNLFDKYCSVNYSDDLMDKNLWIKINNIPDKELWYAHNNLKNKFFNFVKERISSSWTREGEDPALLDRFLINLNPSPLTIGFARRFATYKRATMFLSDFERMKRNLLNKKFPLQMVFAGKAHPDDIEGARLIKEIVKLSKQEEFLGKIIFLEDYNIAMARKMVAGVDVWLNNPVRPMEASGTSGMKAGINGVLNCSILDGWWEEGYNTTNGWAIGDRKQYKNPETQNQSDTDSFYDLLENEIIPSYYSRNTSGIPEKWLKMLRSSIISVITEYNTHRMLKDYVTDMYVPAARKYHMMSENNFEKANEITQWVNNIRNRFSTIHIHNVIVRGSHGDVMNVNDELEVIIELDKGKLTRDEIRVQMVVIHDTSDDSIEYSERPEFYDEAIEYIGLSFSEENDNILTYHCKYKATESGKFNYGIRVLPHHMMLEDSCDMNLIYWA